MYCNICQLYQIQMSICKYYLGVMFLLWKRVVKTETKSGLLIGAMPSNAALWSKLFRTRWTHPSGEGKLIWWLTEKRRAFHIYIYLSTSTTKSTFFFFIKCNLCLLIKSGLMSATIALMHKCIEIRCNANVWFLRCIWTHRK